MTNKIAIALRHPKRSLFGYLKNNDILKMNHKTWHKTSKVQQEPFKIKSHVSGGTNLNKFPFLSLIANKRAITI